MSDNNKQQPWVMAIPVVSTGHIPAEVREKLDASSMPYGLYSASYPDGWFIACGENGDDDEGLPEPLAAVLQWARKAGYEWVRLDTDGDEIDGLPTYE